MALRDTLIKTAEAHGYSGGETPLGAQLRHPNGNQLDVYKSGYARHVVADGHDVDQHACAHDRCAHVTQIATAKQLRDTLKKAHPKAPPAKLSADARITSKLRGR